MCLNSVSYKINIKTSLNGECPVYINLWFVVILYITNTINLFFFMQTKEFNPLIKDKLIF